MVLSVTREVRLTAGAGLAALTEAPYHACRIEVTGPLLAETGYIINVKTIDTLVDEVIHARLAAGPWPEGSLVLYLWQNLPARLPALIHLSSIEMSLTPQVRYSMSHESAAMLNLTCQFEFSAAHRLYVSTLSEEENRREFGKCVTLHGHNYVLEVAVAGASDPVSGEVYPLARLQETVKRLVVDRFDHICLNSDVSEFVSLNPTVENLATVVWNLLEGKFAPAVLQRVRIYETPKIWADCSREPN